MVTSINNNIKRNFVKYINRFIKSSFAQKFKTDLEECPLEDRKTLKNRQKADLYEIKNDFIHGTTLSHPDYHDWIKTVRPFMIPKIDSQNLLEKDLEVFPQKYLSGMIYMCLQLETLGVKSFQFFPLRKNSTPHFIPIDTASLISLFVTENKNEKKKHITEIKHEIWSTFFKLKHQVFRSKNYMFDYRIHTDGFSVSLQMINKDLAPKNEADKKASNEKAKVTKQRRKGMTPEEKAEDIKRVQKEQYAKQVQKVHEESQRKKKPRKN